MLQDNLLEESQLIDDRKRNLEKLYSDKYGYRIKIMTDEPYMEEMLKMYCGDLDSFTYKVPKIGDIVKGKVIRELDKYIVIDINYKDNIYIDKKGQELEVLRNLDLEFNQEIDVLITAIDEESYEIRGSIAEIFRIDAERKMSESIDDHTMFYNGYIRELTPAGYFVEIDVDGVKTVSFMPKTLAGINKLPNPESIVGQTMEVMIENKTNEGFIVSRKKYLKSLIEESVKELQYGKVYQGHVTGTTDFGIFVEFEGCLTGMIHKGNVNPEYATQIQSIQPGTEIDFYIQEVIHDRARDNYKIILTQLLRETLWDTIKIGDTMKATVKSTKPFGVLVHLDESTIGLVHISEVEKFGDKAYEAGDEMEVKVISVQRSERKIFLTINNG